MTHAFPQHRLLGFGSNYFYALGGSKPIELAENVLAHAFDDDEYLREVQQLACTTSSSLILRKDGSVFQVGMMHGQQLPLATRIHFREKIIEIAGGRHFCLARNSSSSVLSWGAGHFGQLGHGPHISWLEHPEVISHLQPHVLRSPVIQIACGSWHGAALTQDGRILCWGSNRKNQCGTKSPATIVYPQLVEGVNVAFSQVSCGRGHCIALEKATGRVYTWGDGSACGHSPKKLCVSQPKLVEALQRVIIVMVSAGDAHSLALTGGGRVFSWGYGHEGQLGIGGAFPLIPRPKLIGDLDFVAVVAGQQLNPTGRVSPTLDSSMSNIPFVPNLLKSNGSNGSDSGKFVTSGNAAMLANVPKVVMVRAVGCYSVAVSSAGHVYVWGYNDASVLGLPLPNQSSSLPMVEPVVSSTTPTLSQIKCRILEGYTFDSRHNVLLPRRVDSLADLDVKLVAGGPSHLLVWGSVRDPSQPVTVGRTLYEVQLFRRSSLVSTDTSIDGLSEHSLEDDAVTTDTLSQTTGDMTNTSPEAASRPMENHAQHATAMKRPESPVHTSLCPKHVDSPASAPTPTSRREAAARKPRALSMSRLIQKLTPHHGNKRGIPNGDQKIRSRVFGNGFGSGGGSK
jgi:alpha-tubulin suppressor-like RCC1 family protein